jgi:hypothetical protein
MSRQITIPFQVTLWDLKPYDETSGATTLSRGTVKKSFAANEATGKSAGEILMFSAPDGSAAYTILDKFTVELEGRKGSFAAIHGATHSPKQTSRAIGTILQGSGTGELAGISGTIEFIQGENGKNIILEYLLEDES